MAAIASLGFGAVPSVAQEDAPVIQRYLGDLYLGDSLEDVQRIYPPAQEWPSQKEPRSGVTRVRVERGYAKNFPADVDTLWLGFKKGSLVEIQLIYNARFSRKKPAERLADDMALIYGEPRRANDRFWWTDGVTVLRVFAAELPASADHGEAVALRTSIQILERAFFRRSS
jgi:hypothetical protein